MVNYMLFNFLAPSRLSIWWTLGFSLGMMIVAQVLSGFCLACYYVPEVDVALNSVVSIVKEVNGGWFIHHIHSCGASAIFFLLYFHMLKSLFYYSYTSRRRVWWSGILIYIFLSLEAFLGYILPWGQMAYWAGTVITNLIQVVPVLGGSLYCLILGGSNLGSSTLRRFYILHVLIPFFIFGLILLHLFFLHEKGSSTPYFWASSFRFVRFYPTLFFFDLFSFCLIFLIFLVFVFQFPYLLGDVQNWVPVDSLQTPVSIVPEWYFLWDYAVLRCIPNKVLGVLVLVFFYLLLVLFPLLKGKGRVIQGVINPIYCLFALAVFIGFFSLSCLGATPPEWPYVRVTRFYLFYTIVLFLIALFFLRF
uniref:cytochrome b n=1 Tax=Polypodium hydriforme TaxID=43186 RepID=UPI0021154DDE|nr:cytochrome b [Polypodium hydriforme]USZ79613.1 cytochrome b [Polypodium hydriforme]